MGSLLLILFLVVPRGSSLVRHDEMDEMGMDRYPNKMMAAAGGGRMQARSMKHMARSSRPEMAAMEMADGMANLAMMDEEMPIPPHAMPMRGKAAMGASVPAGSVAGNVGETIGKGVEKMIVKNGHMSMEAEDPRSSRAKIEGLVTAAGGFVQSTSENLDSKRTYHSDCRRPHGASESGCKPSVSVSMNVKIPSGKFEATIDSIRALALKVTSLNTHGEDVTEQYLDAATRAANLEVTHKQLGKLMESAHSVKEVLEVQRELTRVTSDLEAHKGRAEYLKKSSSMSTLNLNINEPRPEPFPDKPQVPRIQRIIYRELRELQETGWTILEGLVWVVIVAAPVP
mmetsp:Transcript_25295/g.80002  ORF Transcript_25295/g.80002 Transcript_25295/m.80002 type:complete len:342 (+) Transcript_25295:425-1450(+)